MKNRFVCSFNDRSTATAELLGMKGASLAQMSQSGIPIPAGFTVTTDSCTRYYDDNKVLCDEIVTGITENIGKIEVLTGKRFGGAGNPLLLSVRSGSRQSVPGLMDTILHLGMNDNVAESLSIRMSDPRTAYEYYLNFIATYSNMVKRYGKKQYAGIMDDYKAASGRTDEFSLTDLLELVRLYKESYKNNLGEEFPSDPMAQLIGAVGAGFHYWDSPRANYYRMVKEIPYSWGTAVTIQTMVYGNLVGERSGTGVAFTRNPSSGRKERLGEFLLDSRTGDVLGSKRVPEKLDLLKQVMPDVYAEFERDCFLIENKYRDIFEINFIIEDGNLFIIKTRKAKRTALAAFTAACEFADDGVCSEKEAIKVLDPANITALRPTGSLEDLLDGILEREADDPEAIFESANDYKPTDVVDGNIEEFDETSGDIDRDGISNEQEEEDKTGGIYNFSLFDYELDDIMTQIYSGFNVYDEDNDDSSVTDELKRIMTERIPSVNIDPESVVGVLPEDAMAPPEIETDELPELMITEEPSVNSDILADVLHSAMEVAAAVATSQTEPNDPNTNLNLQSTDYADGVFAPDLQGFAEKPDDNDFFENDITDDAAYQTALYEMAQIESEVIAEPEMAELSEKDMMELPEYLVPEGTSNSDLDPDMVLPPETTGFYDELNPLEVLPEISPNDPLPEPPVSAVEDYYEDEYDDEDEIEIVNEIDNLTATDEIITESNEEEEILPDLEEEVIAPQAVIDPEQEIVVMEEPEEVEEPETVIEPEPETVIEPEPEAVIEPEPEAVIEPEPEAVIEPEPEAVIEPEPEAVIEPEPTPAVTAVDLLNMIDNAKPKAHKIKVIPIKRR